MSEEKTREKSFNTAWAAESLVNLSQREKLDPKHKHVELPPALSDAETQQVAEIIHEDDAEHMDEDLQDHTLAAASGKGGGTVVWELLQKGLKKAMGATRDQLEFTIKIRSMFDAFDRSGDGDLSGQELRKALREMGVHVSKREMKSLMLRFDQNHDGQIDHSEFEVVVVVDVVRLNFEFGIAKCV